MYGDNLRIPWRLFIISKKWFWIFWTFEHYPAYCTVLSPVDSLILLYSLNSLTKSPVCLHWTYYNNCITNMCNSYLTFKITKWNGSKSIFATFCKNVENIWKFPNFHGLIFYWKQNTKIHIYLNNKCFFLPNLLRQCVIRLLRLSQIEILFALGNTCPHRSRISLPSFHTLLYWGLLIFFALIPSPNFFFCRYTPHHHWYYCPYTSLLTNSFRDFRAPPKQARRTYCFIGK